MPLLNDVGMFIRLCLTDNGVGRGIQEYARIAKDKSCVLNQIPHTEILIHDPAMIEAL